MSDAASDRLTGAILLLFAGAWIALVLGTFPEVTNGPTGARTYPLASGILLALLSAMLIAGSFLRRERPAGGDKPAAGVDAIERRGIAATFGFLLVYLALLNYVGFILATVIALAGFLYLVLGKRSPWLLIGYPAGFAFGIWFLLGKVMGVYLPRGEFINLF